MEQLDISLWPDIDPLRENLHSVTELVASHLKIVLPVSARFEAIQQGV